MNSKTLPPNKNKNNYGLTSEDYLTIKTGELCAKTEELNEANESLHNLNYELRLKTEEIKKSNKSLLNADNNLLIVNNILTKTNEEFAKVNKDLAAVNKELVRVNEQIKQRNIKQKEFISIASHELRTPTQSILGYTELMLLEPQTKTKYAKLIMRNANRLQKIISDILDVSKIYNNALTLNKEHFKLTEVISGIVTWSRDQLIHNNKSVNIIFDNIDIEKEEEENNIVIDADKERITQVISNILDNAIRFTKEGIIHINIERNNIINNNKDNIDSNSEEIVIKIIDSVRG